MKTKNDLIEFVNELQQSTQFSTSEINDKLDSILHYITGGFDSYGSTEKTYVEITTEVANMVCDYFADETDVKQTLLNVINEMTDGEVDLFLNDFSKDRLLSLK